MKAKFFALLVMGLVALAVIFSVQQAQASNHAALVLEKVFSGVNTGELESALDGFNEDATAENLVRAETYRGLDEIRGMLDGMQRPGRQFEIVSHKLSGDTVTAQVEVSDGGHVWGTQTVQAIIQGDRVQSFAVTAFRLELWRILSEN